MQKNLYHIYAKARGWITKPADMNFLKNAIRQWNGERWQRYQKKIFRDCSSFVKTKNLFKFSIVDRDYLKPEFLDFLSNPECVFKREDSKILKAGRTSTVIKIKIGEQILVIKRYNIKNFWHGLRRCLRSTRAACSWRLANQLRFVGIATAKPIAFIEKRFLGLRFASYFIMQYVPGMDADEYFEEANIESSQCVTVARRMIALFFNLARLNICHGDLKMTNILVDENRYPILIDLDSMREHHFSAGLWHRFRKDMRRFLKNWQGNPPLLYLFEQLIAEMGVA